MEELEKESCVRGYYVYSAIWDAKIREQVSRVRESRNERGRYAVAVVKDGVVLSNRIILEIISSLKKFV